MFSWPGKDSRRRKTFKREARWLKMTWCLRHTAWFDQCYKITACHSVWHGSNKLGYDMRVDCTLMKPTDSYDTTHVIQKNKTMPIFSLGQQKIMQCVSSLKIKISLILLQPLNKKNQDFHSLGKIRKYDFKSVIPRPGKTLRINALCIIKIYYSSYLKKKIYIYI